MWAPCMRAHAHEGIPRAAEVARSHVIGCNSGVVYARSRTRSELVRGRRDVTSKGVVYAHARAELAHEILDVAGL